MTAAGRRGEGERRRRAAAVQVFRREGEYWTIVYDGQTIRLRDVRGLQHLAVLLANPDTEVPAVALEQRSLPAQSWAAAREQTVPHDARERARVNVTRALSAAMKRIAANHPELGRHLARTVRTGTFCAYRPDPRAPIAWTS